jgi:hypothetical protein
MKTKAIISPAIQAVKGQCIEVTNMLHKADNTIKTTLKNMIAIFTKHLHMNIIYPYGVINHDIAEPSK